MEGYITIYDNDSEPRRDVIITKEAVHEEELMKSDLIRLSWVDEERYVLPAGWYIEPFTDLLGIDGQPARFTLHENYQPERTVGGFRYQPEFMHPKMWLGYVPYVFTTQDASGIVVRKTEFPFIGQLSTLLVNICDFINGAYGLPAVGKMLQDMTPEERTACTSFVVYPLSIDYTQTVSVTFKDTDILSAIADVAKVADCEWHIDWDARFLYFGQIRLGVTAYDLTAEGNVGVPSVTRSSDKLYNAFIVHGSSRNNSRHTENGNIAVSAPLTLAWDYDGDGNVIFHGLEDDYGNEKYPDSIIDTRPWGDGGEQEGVRLGPRLTQVLNVEDVYPRYELYVYDLVERKKFKTNGSGDITSERWSIWYMRLARKVSDGVFEEFRLTTQTFAVVKGRSWRWYDPANGQTIIGNENVPNDPPPAPTATAVFEYTDKAIFTNLPFAGAYFLTGYYTEGNQRVLYFYCTVSCNGYDFEHIGVRQRTENGLALSTLYPLEGYSGAFSGLCSLVTVGGRLYFPDIDVDIVPSANKQTYEVDGLVPTIAFQINDAEDAVPSSLGTREFEVVYHTKEVTFNESDDVEGTEMVRLRVRAKQPSTNEIELDLVFDDGVDYFVNYSSGVTLLYDGVEYDHVMLYEGAGTYTVLSLDDQSLQHPEWMEEINVGDYLYFTYGFNIDVMPDGTVVSDGGYKGTVLPAGYYEIIHKEEGSDKLCVPTTTEQTIIPRQYTKVIGEDIVKNNRCTIFNIVMGDEAKLTAQTELEAKAKKLIGEMLLDLNNYTFKSNSVVFEDRNPNLYIGRMVHFSADGLDLTTRILKLTTHIDYSFEQEITVGNTLLKGQMARYKDELRSLQETFENWLSGGTGATASIGADMQSLIVERGSWSQGELYYFESYNRATGKIETSSVVHYGGAKWHCRRNLTAQEPSPGCTDWEMVEPPTLQYVEYDHWSEDVPYYYETLNVDEDRLETSRVWHYDALWECRRSFTSEEPSLGCSDWVLLRMPTISLPFFDGDGLPLMVLPVHSEGVIEETIVPKLMFGQYDFSEAVTAWQWERESDFPDLDAIWNAQARARQQSLTLVNADFPSAWWTGTLSWKCTAWFEGVGQEAVELTNVITV